MSGPVAGDDLLIVNMTDQTCALSLGCRDLGSMPPYERREINVARRGGLVATKPAEDMTNAVEFLGAWIRTP